jgi:ketosteroid isomerase-like protein
MLQSWLFGKVVGWVMAALRRGDVRPAILLDARDVVLRFPGENSWAGIHEGRDAHRRWEQRLVDVGLQIHVDEVVAVGTPWRTTVCIRGTDHLDAPTGERVYENRYVIWARLRWFRMKEIEVYEDTEESARLDVWLADNEARIVAV